MVKDHHLASFFDLAKEYARNGIKSLKEHGNRLLGNILLIGHEWWRFMAREDGWWKIT